LTTTVTWSPTVQFGTGDAFNVFTQFGVITLGAFGITGGLLFDAGASQSLRFATVGGQSRILDGPVVDTLSFVCDVNTTVLGGDNTALVEFGLVADPQPANYVTGLAPWFRNEISLGNYTVTCVLDPAQATQTITMSSDAMALIRAHATSSARWNGRLALSMRRVSGLFPFFRDTGLNVQASAQTTQERFFSGLAGGPAGKVRAVRDGRFGMPAMSTELMRDGDQPSLWVRDFDVDPEDPDATYRPKPGEGTTDDEIPNP